jgi:hypothetical protein
MAMTKIVTSAFFLAALSCGTPTLAASDHIQAGSLTCDVSAGIGMIIGSKRSVDCIFTPSTAGGLEHYQGTITNFGLDVGALKQGSLIWLVYAPSKRGPGALQGDYAGAQADATFVVGLGANVLVGGFSRSIALQPVSIEGNQGFNIAVGIASLKLRYEPPAPAPSKTTTRHKSK